MKTHTATLRKLSFQIISGLAMSAFLSFPMDIDGAAVVQGPNGPKSGIEQNNGCLACPGTSWATINNVIYKDSLFAVTQLSASTQCFQGACYYPRGLLTRNYHFSIPSGAVINGIKVDVWHKAGTISAIADSAVQLMKNDTTVGSNNASAQTWPLADTMATYGGPTNLWGTTWLPADVNDSGFGVMLRPINRSAAPAQASFDYAQITVYFTSATAARGPTQSAALHAPTVHCIPDPKGIRISFTIHKSAEYYSIGLFNAAGKCISRKTATGVRSGEEHNEMFNVHANGLYFVRIGWPEGSISNRVLINN